MENQKTENKVNYEAAWKTLKLSIEKEARGRCPRPNERGFVQTAESIAAEAMLERMNAIETWEIVK